MKFSKEIESLVPYKTGKPISETKREYGLSQVYKLASNENPIGVSPKVIDAIQAALSSLHRYPDPTCYELTQKISKILQVKPETLVFGNGSNECIDLLIRLFCEPGDKIITSQAAFIAYKICAQAARVETTEVEMNEDFKIDLNGLVQKLSSKHKLIFLPNPNNPTGTYVNQAELDLFFEQVGDREDLYVVIDEAYNEFVRATDYQDGLHYFKKYKNVILSRTFSKVFGIAGLRLGYMVLPEEIANLMHRIRNPFNVNSLSQAAGLAILDDKEYLKKSQEVIWQGLDYFYEKFDRMGLKYYPSQANFLLVDLARDAKQVSDELLKRGVIVRPVANYGLMQHLRISLGLPEENEIAMKHLQEVL